MKLQDTNSSIEQIGNVSNEAGFKMRSSRKAFQILSDLYSDKPLAIVRELGCNAHDSHVQAGKGDKPFHIHAPNSLEPWITIQDFGTGISHEDIYNIYTIYFESTKTNTNDQIGCLGLGSKSPFCYTDNFTITSNFDGVKRIYNAYFNATSMPTIALLSTEATTEENGIAIQIPVKPEDFGNFHHSIKKSFRFFGVRPTISGAEIIWDDEKPILSGEDWVVYKSFGYNESYAIMGGVTYSLDVHKIDKENREIVQRSGLVMKFQTGELDIVPSREGLSYCPETIKALNEKVVKAIADIKVTITDSITTQTNIFDAIKMYNILQSKFTILGSHFQGFKWNAQDIGSPVKLVWDILEKNKVAKAEAVVSVGRNTWGRAKFTTSSNPYFHDTTIWYNNDLTRGGLSRVKEYINSNEKVSITMFSPEAVSALIKNGFPASVFVKTSSLPSVIKAKSTNPNKNVSKTLYTMGQPYHNTWDRKDFDANNPPKYFFEKGQDWYLNISINGLHTIASKSELCNLLSFMGIDRNSVVMVAKKNMNLLASCSTNLIDYINANINLNYDADDMATLEKYMNGSWTTNRMIETTKNDKFKALKNSPFKNFIIDLVKTNQKINENSRMDLIINKIKGNKKKGKSRELVNPNPIEKFCFKKLNDGSISVEAVCELLEILQKDKK
jgi:hypothetical protein